MKKFILGVMCTIIALGAVVALNTTLETEKVVRYGQHWEGDQLVENSYADNATLKVKSVSVGAYTVEIHDGDLTFNVGR